MVKTGGKWKSWKFRVYLRYNITMATPKEIQARLVRTRDATELHCASRINRVDAAIRQPGVSMGEVAELRDSYRADEKSKRDLSLQGIDRLMLAMGF